MGAIARALANSITTGGVVKASAINNTSVSSVTALPSGADTGDLVLISSQTASASATISFTSGLDSTYDEYMFKFYDIHAQNDSPCRNDFSFNGSTDGGSNYNVTKTSSSFLAQHNEADNNTDLKVGGLELAQSTGFQAITNYQGNDNDQASSGELILYSPSDTTYVKHFLTKTSNYTASDFNVNLFIGGYFNTTSAINAVQFKFTSGNIDSGVIKLFGVKKS